MPKKTIKIKESDLHKIISKVIAEVSYNYHIGNIEDVSNIKPYYSDNKKKILWSKGYFCSTVGEASEKTIEEYIKNQG